jgi:hypothetical protein
MQLLEALKYQKYIIKSIKSQDRVEELKVVKDHQVESPEDSIQLIKQLTGIMLVDLITLLDQQQQLLQLSLEQENNRDLLVLEKPHMNKSLHTKALEIQITIDNLVISHNKI